MMRKTIWVLLTAMVLVEAHGALAGKRKTHVIEKGDTPSLVAKRHGITVDELLRYNNLKPESGFRIGTELVIPEPGEVTGDKYSVKPGDSVAKIADYHGCSQNDLREANGLREGTPLRVGQELTIPYELRGGVGRSHVVSKGDTLSSIAAKHKVSVTSMARANKITPDTQLQLGRTLIIPDDEADDKVDHKPKKVSKLVKSGVKVPGGVRHTIQPGQSLWVIARAYNTTGERIAEANGFEVTDQLLAGDEILIPGAKQVVPMRVKGFVVQPVSFISVWNNKPATLKLISNSGKLIHRSRRILSRLAGPKRKTKNVKLLHPRLIHMLQRVAERFPGHVIEIVSGYRPRVKGQALSKHNVGRALDFRVRGIDRRALYDYIKQLPKVGAGYYPNSVFVHMDVRDKKTLWTDFSGIGEDSRYAKDGYTGDAQPEAEAAADALEAGQ